MSGDEFQGGAEQNVAAFFDIVPVAPLIGGVTSERPSVIERVSSGGGWKRVGSRIWNEYGDGGITFEKLWLESDSGFVSPQNSHPLVSATRCFAALIRNSASPLTPPFSSAPACSTMRFMVPPPWARPRCCSPDQRCRALRQGRIEIAVAG